MRRESANKNIKLIEALPDGKWGARWDIRYNKKTKKYEYEEMIYNYIPSIDDIKTDIFKWINLNTDINILQGYVYKGYKVWLTNENQYNYKSIYDLAVSREKDIKEWDINNPEKAGKNSEIIGEIEFDGKKMPNYVPTGRPMSIMPVTFKFGEQDYYTFNELNELKDFFEGCVIYIQSCYQRGWDIKNNFNFKIYEEELKKILI